MKEVYPRPRKKSFLKRFKENFELNEIAYVIVFMIALALAMFLFIVFCFTIKGPTWGYL